MRQHSLFAPVTVLAIGLIIIAVLLGTSYGQSSATPSLAYTPAENTGIAQTATAAYIPPPDRTATTKAKTATGADDNSNATAAATTRTSTTTRTTAQATIAPTVAPAASAASAPTTVATTPTLLPTREATATPLPTPTPLADFQCVPGVPVTIEGEGPPNAGILLLFNERVVSGGVVRANGLFRMQLVIGDEDPGVYPFVVQVRGTETLLLEKTCFVPAITPTPPPLGTGP